MNKEYIYIYVNYAFIEFDRPTQFDDSIQMRD